MTTQTETRYFANRYAGVCQTCRQPVAAMAGFTGKENGKYVAYCKAHVPAQIQATATSRTMGADGVVRTPYEPQNLALLRALPGARWNPDHKAWSFSLDMQDRPRVLEIADKLGLTVADGLRVVVKTEQAEVAEHKGLYPFQVVGVNWLAQRRTALMGDDMGLGKTVQTLVALPKDAAVIVVAPAAVKYNWKDEILKWAPHFKATIINGKGKFQWPQAGEIVIINFDILPASFAEMSPAETEQAKRCVVVVDEAHKCKNYKTARSKRVAGLCKNALRVWGLTGTPLMNRPSDLYGVLSSLNMAYETFGGFGNYMRLFGATKDRWGGIEWGTPDASVPERLRRVMLRRRKDDVLPDLPSITVTDMTVNGVSAALMSRMDDLEDEWGGVIDSGELPDFQEFSALRAQLAESRIPTLLEMAEDHEEQEIPLVVASAHLTPINALGEREGWAVITGDVSAEKRQDIVRRFQAGEFKGIGITIQAGGVGITLTRAWKMIFVDLDWVPANNMQCQDRIRRIGQTKPVEIVRMVSDHILDRHVQFLLVEKMAMIDAAVEKEITAIVPTPVQGETAEQFEQRMAEAKAIAVETASKAPAQPAWVEDKAARINARIMDRVKDGLPELTAERVEAVKQGFNLLLSVCDGAHAKDGAGFNGADQYLSRWLAGYGLENEREVRTAYCLIWKYKGQLGNNPVLFPVKD